MIACMAFARFLIDPHLIDENCAARLMLIAKFGKCLAKYCACNIRVTRSVDSIIIY